MADLHGTKRTVDSFLVNYQPSELKIASEFLSTWLPFLSRDLCPNCTDALSNRIRSLETELEGGSNSSSSNVVDHNCNCAEGSSGIDDRTDANSLSSSKDGDNGLAMSASVSTTRGLLGKAPSLDGASSRMSWADMAQEDEMSAQEDQLEEEEEENGSSKPVVNVRVEKPVPLSRDQREHIRFMNVKRKKDFICLERIRGRPVNVLDGLELHECVFSSVEQKRIVDYIHTLEEKGRKGELKERTFTAPQKWMRGKGRVTIQFGCCYNYATDKKGNPPGILYNEVVDPIPHLLKVIIRRLIKWHVLPTTCVPDSCIVNIYDEGDCIPPHIDNHDFVRPFCTVSFLSECNIVFGSNLKIESPGEFSGSFAVPLPVGSVLVLNGNGADVAKHCLPAVPNKRISITFRRMHESKRPAGYTPEPDLQGIEPLPYDIEKPNKPTSPISDPRHSRRYLNRRGGSSNNNIIDARGSDERIEPRSEPRYSSRGRGRGSGILRRPA